MYDPDNTRNCIKACSEIKEYYTMIYPVPQLSKSFPRETKGTVALLPVFTCAHESDLRVCSAWRVNDRNQYLSAQIFCISKKVQMDHMEERYYQEGSGFPVYSIFFHGKNVFVVNLKRSAVLPFILMFMGSYFCLCFILKLGIYCTECSTNVEQMSFPFSENL